jgi:hypothetical protein
MKKLLLLSIFLSVNLLFGQTATAPSAGDGSAGNPYQIATLNNLYWIAANTSRWANHYIQTSTIDASSTTTWFSNGSGGYYGWIPIGNTSTKFTGSYNGGGYTIDGLYINRSSTDCIGFIGFTAGANISNIGLSNVSILGKWSVGGLVGVNELSTISNSYSTGSVTGVYNIGGLLGEHASSTLSNCYSKVSVSSTDYAGGLVGATYNYDCSINKCYSTGLVTGGSYTGGLIGYRMYTTINNCFWDSVSSGKATSAGGTGKTTIEMKTSSTFLDAGWEGTIWNKDIGINDGYPYLKWQNPSGTPLPVELTSFTANISGSNVTLNWQTVTEVNNYGFYVERRRENEQNFYEVKDGFIPGHGSTLEPQSYSFIDNTVTEVGKYYYRLRQVDNDGLISYSSPVSITISVLGVDEQLPLTFNLEQNYPNPFNPATTIKYSLPVRSYVIIKVYSILGNEIATLVNGYEDEGFKSLKFDGSILSSGIYIYKIVAGNYSEVKRMLLIK